MEFGLQNGALAICVASIAAYSSVDKKFYYLYIIYYLQKVDWKKIVC